MSEQRFGATGLLFDPSVATLGEWAVPGQMIIALSLGTIGQLLAGRVGSVEGNGLDVHSDCALVSKCQVILGQPAPSAAGPAACKQPSLNWNLNEGDPYLWIDESNPPVLLVVRSSAS